MKLTRTISDPVRHDTLRRCLAAALLCHGLAAAALADNKSWNAGNGSWFDPGNWSPSGVPSSDDAIRIGNLPGVQNATVTLGHPGSGYALLEITSGMTLDMDGGELVSFELASITGENSRLIARPAPGGINEHNFNGTLELGTGAHFELRDNVPVRIHGDSVSHGTISGRGLFLIASTEPFDNAGVIRPSNNGGLIVQQGTFGDRVIDLDGLWGTGHLMLDTPFSQLEVVADSLIDWYSGDITMAPGALLTMTLANDWRADVGCLLDVIGTSNPNAASQIAGSPFIFEGTMNVNSFEAHLRVLANVTFEQNADVVVGFTDWLELDGATTVAGGQFTQGNQGVIDFDGPTTVRGGQFFTNSPDPANGAIDFNGATTWNGACDIVGVARQMGNAFVSGPTVINADVLDMDGDGDTLWTVWQDLVLNADSVQSDDGEAFNGTITVANGTVGRFELNLPDATTLFPMAGEMNLIGHPSTFSTRYAGNPLDLLGTLNVSGKVAIDATLRAFDGTVDIGNANAVLRLDRGGVITANSTFTGDGELWIGPTGHPLFTDVNLSTVGLVNQGTLQFQSNISTDHFTQENGAVWEISLSGYEAGVDYDQLRVTSGGATLAGSIEVELQTPFAPAVGDEFVILRASGGVTGTFNADPTNCSDGRVYQWTVLYGGNDVRLRLDAITGLLGDTNCDCAVNAFDIEPFLLALFEPSEYGNGFPDCDISNADVNEDGVVNAFDIEGFLACLFP